MRDRLWRIEPLEPRIVLAGSVEISEFLADNKAGLADEEGDSGDWIELHNTTAGEINLAGWHLTDKQNDPASWWTFPNVSIGSGAYLIVFASGKDPAPGPLHASFNLNKAGEYLALIQPDGTIEHEFAPNFPEQFENVSYGLNSSAEERYFTTPSPGQPNSAGVVAFVEDTTFSVDRGFYTSPFQLVLATDTAGATIRYTTNGSEPTQSNGSTYTAPLTISQTTTLRVRAYRTGYQPSNVDTQTYIFLSDVLTQSPTGQRPTSEWPNPSSVNGPQEINYGMDPAIVNSGLWGPQLVDALTQIPTMSIVTNLSNLFNSSTGIYVNAGQHGANWERPTSLELINPDGSEGFQIDAGIRIRGGFSRSNGNPKHAFRFFFRSEYGQSKLNYPLFGDEGADEFDAIDLRTAQNYSWSFQGNSNNTFIRDEFSRLLQGDLGNQYARGRYYHLYINGQYWGLFQTDERTESSFSESYFGGDADDYDVVKSAGSTGGYTVEATDGNLDAYRRLYDQAIAGFTTNEAYNLVQGLNPDGTRNPSYERLLDVDNLIDYMLLTYFTSDSDGPGSRFTGRPNNFFASYNRENPDGFKWFEHDSEHSLGVGHNSGIENMVTPLTSDYSGSIQSKDFVAFQYFNPHWLHEKLAEQNDEYRLRFADRAYKHYFNDGAMTYANNIARIDSLTAQFDIAIIAESARWGDAKNGSPYTKNHWINAVNVAKNWLVNRDTRVINQLKSISGSKQKSWYPNTAAPNLRINGNSMYGGQINAGDGLTLTTTTGKIYLTLDGSDPRAIGGALAAGAKEFKSGTVVLTDSTNVKARVLASNGEWSPLADASFLLANTSGLVISEIHYNPADADNEVSPNDTAQDFEFVEIFNAGGAPISLPGYRIEGINFTFDADSSVTTLNPGEYAVVVKNLTAFSSRYNTTGMKIVGEYVGSLDNSGETLRLFDNFDRQLVEVDYSDGWYAATDGDGYSLSILNPLAHPSTLDAKSAWRPSSTLHGSPGAADAATIPPPNAVVINEVLSHTDASVNGDWIELRNTTSQPINLGGWYLSDDKSNLRKFRIPDNTMILGNSFLVFDQFGPGGFGADPDNPGSFGLSELGDTAYLTSPDPGLVREDINAVHVLANGNYLISTKKSSLLGTNLLSFGDGDLVEYNPTTGAASVYLSEKIFDGGNEDIDAVSVRANGTVILSTGGSASLAGFSFGKSDLVQIVPGVGTDLAHGILTGATVSRFFSGSLFSLPEGGNAADIDAVHVFEDNRVVISASDTVILGGLTFDDGDLIEIVPGAGTNLANGVLGSAIVRKYLSESAFAIEPGQIEPTENIDGIYVQGNGAVVLSTTSRAQFVGIGTQFQNGDLVRLTPGTGANLANGVLGTGATLSIIFSEQPVVGRTFWPEAGAYREDASFGAIETEVTLGRYQKADGGYDFTALVSGTRGGPNSAARVGPIVINEVQYHPAAGQYEFIELRNISGAAVQLYGDPGDPATNPGNTWKLTDGVSFTFPAATAIPAGGYVVILPAAPPGFATFNDFVTAFRALHGLSGGVPIYGPYTGSLANDGENVALSRPGVPEPDNFVPYITVDRVNYGDKWPWPTEPDGTGPSLSRWVSTNYGNDAFNWLASGAGTHKGTPGAANTTVDTTAPTAPVLNSATTISATRIDLAWSPAVDPHSGVSQYRIYRNGVFLGQTAGTSFSDNTAMVGQIYSYSVAAVNGVAIEGAQSVPKLASVVGVLATIVPDKTHIEVVFSEAVGPSAENTSNYSVSGPSAVNVTSAVRNPDGRTVRLTVSQLTEQAAYQLTVSGITAASGNAMPPTPQVVGVVVPDVTAPRITGVLVDSSRWTETLRSYLAAGQGAAGGYLVPGGPNQSTPLTWPDVDRLRIRFDEHVEISQEDLSLAGVTFSSYPFTGFEYDPATFTATWTLGQALRVDKLLVDLSEQVEDAQGNRVDGNWSDGASSYPSGNGERDTDDRFLFRIDVVSGDLDGNGTVNGADLSRMVPKLGTTTTMSAYDVRYDLNGDGRVTMADLRGMLRRLGGNLPAGDPVPNTPPPVLIATDEVFQRIGGGGGGGGGGATALAAPAENTTSPSAASPQTASAAEGQSESSVLTATDSIFSRTRTVRRLTIVGSDSTWLEGI